MGNEHIYTCKECGCHEFAEYTYSYVTQLRKTGSLDEDHHWEYKKEQEEIIDEYEEKGELEVFCHQCYAKGKNQEELWETEEDSELEYETDGFYVVCHRCKREIEFGWSHPDRAGRIWPAESTDFNPWKSWPEPRYRESWKKKGWLKPGTEDWE